MLIQTTLCALGIILGSYIHYITFLFVSQKTALTHSLFIFHSLKLIIVSWDLQILITIDNTLRYSPLFLMVPPPLDTAADNLSSSQLQDRGRLRLISRNFPSKERVEDYNETLFKWLSNKDSGECNSHICLILFARGCIKCIVNVHHFITLSIVLHNGPEWAFEPRKSPVKLVYLNC